MAEAFSIAGLEFRVNTAVFSGTAATVPPAPIVSLGELRANSRFLGWSDRKAIVAEYSEEAVHLHNRGALVRQCSPSVGRPGTSHSAQYSEREWANLL